MGSSLSVRPAFVFVCTVVPLRCFRICLWPWPTPGPAPHAFEFACKTLTQNALNDPVATTTYIGGLGELERFILPPVTGRSASFRLRFRFVRVVRAVRAGEAKLRGRM